MWRPQPEGTRLDGTFHPLAPQAEAMPSFPHAHLVLHTALCFAVYIN